jgi:methionine biosynthesis protein MetW
MLERYFTSLRYYLKRPAAILKYIFTDFPAAMDRMDYDDYWKIRGNFGFSTRYQVFENLIDPGSSVLDIGCGDGSTLKYLHETRNTTGEGLDISESGVKMAREKGMTASVADVSAEDFKIEKVYDYIIISEVLEHIPNPEDVLAKTKGRFSKGLILSIPNTGYYLYRLRLLFGRFPVQWALHPGEHLRFWTLPDFRACLGACGLQVAAMKTHTGFLFLHALWPSLFADTAVFLVRETPARERGIQ